MITFSLFLKILSLYFGVFVYLCIRFRGNIDFSLNKTRVKLIESIVWVLIIWFVSPRVLILFFDFGGFITYQHGTIYLFGDADMLWQIGFFILVTIPIWIYLILKPLYHWTKNGK
jgi:hypothetical protein